MTLPYKRISYFDTLKKAARRRLERVEKVLASPVYRGGGPVVPA